MKLRTLLKTTVLCSMLSGAGAYALTPGRPAPPAPEAPAPLPPPLPSPAPVVEKPVAQDSWRVSFDGALTGAMTLGHTALASRQATETFFLLELHGSNRATRERSPAHLSLVLDRSGSMEGVRWRSALEAAEGALNLLVDGDTFSLVSFGDTATVEIEPTRLDAATRIQCEQRIRKLKLGGDTCVSCGLEASKKLLDQTPDRMQRMLLLSDGETNMGQIAPPALQALAGKIRDTGATLATVGLGSSYNEKLMTLLAVAGNGTAYDVASEPALAKVFAAEAVGLQSVVARDAVLELQMADGVELVRVYERAFRREQGKLLVPLGQVRQGERKVVLVSMKVHPGTERHVVQARIRFHDLTTGAPGLVEGPLSLARAEQSSEPLPGVTRWALGTQTSEVIASANAAFSRGRGADALREVDAQLALLRAEAARAERLQDTSASEALRGQIEKIQKARASYTAPPSPTSARAMK
ncbi:MAG: VWA domain-containing protein, partial [Polyangiaceae bacterium]|nr:VWA domain-containing protein [Polyangiaceae bacterium]